MVIPSLNDLLQTHNTSNARRYDLLDPRLVFCVIEIFDHDHAHEYCIRSEDISFIVHHLIMSPLWNISLGIVKGSMSLKLLENEGLIPIYRNDNCELKRDKSPVFLDYFHNFCGKSRFINDFCPVFIDMLETISLITTAKYCVHLFDLVYGYLTFNRKYFYIWITLGFSSFKWYVNDHLSNLFSRRN